MNQLTSKNFLFRKSNSSQIRNGRFVQPWTVRYVYIRKMTEMANRGHLFYLKNPNPISCRWHGSIKYFIYITQKTRFCQISRFQNLDLFHPMTQKLEIFFSRFQNLEIFIPNFDDFFCEVPRDFKSRDFGNLEILEVIGWNQKSRFCKSRILSERQV